MSLFEKINQDMIKALKAGEKAGLGGSLCTGKVLTGDQAIIKPSGIYPVEYVDYAEVTDFGTKGKAGYPPLYLINRDNQPCQESCGSNLF